MMHYIRLLRDVIQMIYYIRLSRDVERFIYTLGKFVKLYIIVVHIWYSRKNTLYATLQFVIYNNLKPIAYNNISIVLHDFKRLPTVMLGHTLGRP